MISRKKIFLLPVFLSVFLILISIFSFSFFSDFKFNETANAQSNTRDLEGYGWSSNVGWISFKGTAADGDKYGVTVGSNGNLSGYAWSSNVGWIQFGGLSGFPSGAGTTASNASLSGTNFSGWARALANGGGWDGWISLKGTGYGVVETNTSGPGNTKQLDGEIWGDEVMGWIDMSRVYIDDCVGSCGGPEVTPTITSTTLTTAANFCPAKINVVWSVSVNPSGSVPTGTRFSVQRRDGGGAWVNVATGLTSTVRDYLDTIPSSGGSYTYRIQAVLDGVTKNSNISSPAINVPVCGTPNETDPPVIEGFVALPPGGVVAGGQCRLQWSGIQNVVLPSADGSNSCVIRGPGNDGVGTWTYNLSTTTDGYVLSPRIKATSKYTITCTNNKGVDTASDDCRLKPEFIEF